MNKAELLQRFHLTPLAESSHGFHLTKPVKQAAVLIPLFEKDQQIHVLLTKRAAHLNHHAGQISFPGGKIDKSDDDDVYAALRETEEEIGINKERIKVLGKLNPYHVITGYQVSPVIGLLDNDSSMNINKDEVAEVFSAPMSFFLNLDNHKRVKVERGKKSHMITFMPYHHYNIWGATAAMLRDLALHLKPA